jgi:transposase
LCPALRAGDVVVMDNLSSQSPRRLNGVSELIASRGAEVLYLPPYSPDLNLIEKARSKIKQYLRLTRARTKEELDNGITEALALITPDNAQAWFSHSMTALQQL